MYGPHAQGSASASQTAWNANERVPMSNLISRKSLVATVSIVAIIASIAALVVTRGRGLGSSGSASATQPVWETGFRTVRRPYAVNIEAEYDLGGLTIPQEQIHTLVRKDGIPALTDPNLEKVTEAAWLQPEARIIEAVVGTDVLGVPLQILNYHEIVNTTLGGEPIAITYCPLCDSATIFSRRIKRPAEGDSGDLVLEFGVSGALYNSNVLLYDRTYRGLWSQLGMEAVSGPLVGSKLDMLPVRLVTYAEFKNKYPQGDLVSRDTGHHRSYEGSAYGDYFGHDRLMVPVAEMGDALPKKTLGVGIATDEQAWFIAKKTIGVTGFTFDTPKGKVTVAKTQAGIVVQEAPPGIRSAQTFYYSWSAFYPKTVVLSK